MSAGPEFTEVEQPFIDQAQTMCSGGEAPTSPLRSWKLQLPEVCQDLPCLTGLPPDAEAYQSGPGKFAGVVKLAFRTRRSQSRSLGLMARASGET